MIYWVCVPKISGVTATLIRDSQNEALWNGKTVSGPSAQTLGRTLRSSALPPDEGIGLWRSQPQDETPKMRRLTTSYILPL
jgi:hypothetical protein